MTALPEPEEREPEPALPAATVRKRPWRLPIVWIVPLVAAVVAGGLVYRRLQEFGPTVTIEFQDASGVKPDQTEIRYRGVAVGRVTTLELSPDRERVVVTAQLKRTGAGLAREGSLFWIVRPEVGLGAVRGLSTVLTGSYVRVVPGDGPAAKRFVGLENASPTLGRPGLNITLASREVEALRVGASVFYRGIEVGSVTGTELGSDASVVHVRVFIARRYARLVRLGTRFWLVGGVDVDFGLFRGLQISVEPLRALVAGGVAFATPDGVSRPPARDGAVFALHDKPRKEWLEWAPKISLPTVRQAGGPSRPPPGAPSR
jgi:paraquat-inducible protein B